MGKICGKKTFEKWMTLACIKIGGFFFLFIFLINIFFSKKKIILGGKIQPPRD